MTFTIVCFERDGQWYARAMTSNVPQGIACIDAGPGPLVEVMFGITQAIAALHVKHGPQVVLGGTLPTESN